MSFLKRGHSGFTLAELLISLAILGVIATFTIPKILTSATNGQNTAVAKEAASMISGAFQAYTLSNGLSTTSSSGLLTPYMNYVNVDTTASTVAGVACSTATCLKLHNGGYLATIAADTFGTVGTGTTGAISYFLDPDGPSGTATAVQFVLFSTGRLSTGGQAGTSGTAFKAASSFTTISTDPSYLVNWN